MHLKKPVAVFLLLFVFVVNCVAQSSETYIAFEEITVYDSDLADSLLTQARLGKNFLELSALHSVTLNPRYNNWAYAPKWTAKSSAPEALKHVKVGQPASVVTDQVYYKIYFKLAEVTENEYGMLQESIDLYREQSLKPVSADSLEHFVENLKNLLPDDFRKASFYTCIYNVSLISSYYRLGDFKKADNLYPTLIQEHIDTFGKNHPLTIEARGYEGYSLYNKGHTEAADSLLKHILTTSKNTLGEYHPVTTLVRNRFFQPDWPEFPPNKPSPRQRFLQSYERGSEEHQAIQAIDSLARRGSSFMYYEDYARAERVYEEAYFLANRSLGESHPETFSAIGELTYVYNKQGRLEEALRLAVKGMKMRQSVPSTKYPRYHVDFLNSIGLIYHAAREYELAASLYTTALNLSKAHRLRVGPTIVALKNQLARSYRELEQFDKALALYKESLDQARMLYGEESGTLGSVYNNIAKLHEHRGRVTRDRSEYEQAKFFAEKSLELRIKSLGPTDPYLANSYVGMSVLEELTGDTDKAYENYHKAVDIDADWTEQQLLLATDREKELIRKNFIIFDRLVFLTPEDNPLAVRSTFEAIQRKKGSRMDLSLKQRKLTNYDDSRVTELYSTFKEVTHQISEYNFQNRQRDNADIEELYRLREAVEDSLVRYSG